MRSFADPFHADVSELRGEEVSRFVGQPEWQGHPLDAPVKPHELQALPEVDYAGLRTEERLRLERPLHDFLRGVVLGLVLWGAVISAAYGIVKLAM